MDIACYSLSDTTRVTVDGWTTDATRYIRIYTPSTERHDGTWRTSKYLLNPSSAFSRPLLINEDYTLVQGLQVINTGATSSHYGGIGVAATGVVIESTINRGGGASTSDVDGAGFSLSSGSCTLRNYLGYGASSSNVLCLGGTLALENCTIATSGKYGLWNYGGTCTAKNVYSGNNTTADYNGTITRTTCAHSSASSFSGSTGSVAHSTSNFTSVTGGSEDYHLVSGSALRDAGTDLSASFTVDIDGDTRPQNSVFDIGADEYIVVAGGQPTWKRYGGVAYAANNMPGVW